MNSQQSVLFINAEMAAGLDRTDLNERYLLALGPQPPVKKSALTKNPINYFANKD